MAEYFSTPAALTGSDGGQALVEYEIATFDPLLGSWHTDFSFPPAKSGTGPPRRRGALSAAALKALEGEVFGTGISSPRSTRTVVSFDTPMASSDAETDAPTMADTLASPDDTARTVEQRLELSELVARAGLSPQEREVIQLLADDHNEAEIAGFMGLSRGTVSSNRTRARRKLLEAWEKSPPDV